MNRSSLIFVGLLLIFLTSFIGLVIVPYVQLGRLLPEIDDTTHDQTPAAVPGIAEQGRAVYAANGCVYCHTQQVRSRKSGADLDRGWGGEADARRTVARDYLRDRAAYLGTSRMGPDLANVGSRRDKADWHFQHLYDPAQIVPGSNCPPMPFLFERRTIAGQPSIDAIQEPETAGHPAPGAQEIVPTQQARMLVAYLMSLKRSSYKLPEAPPEPAEP